jgi:DNA helicase HerA-like ATPase
MAGRLPQSDDRIAILGKTGSGKTVAGLWHLSKQDIDQRPWIIIDFKGDKNILAIDRAQAIDYSTNLSKLKPGLYILSVMPDEEEALDAWFVRLWSAENIGVMVDEGFMVGQRSRGFNMCLIQGRSKHITMIILSQRPVWMSRYVLSEASFIQMYGLNDRKDALTVKGFVEDKEIGGREVSVLNRLPRYQSYYYDVAKDDLMVLAPVPMVDEILASIDKKLPIVRRTM